MDKNDVPRIINQVFVESFEIDLKELTPEKKIFEELGLDSLDIVDLVVAIQKKFNVKIRDDERIRAIRTLQDLYDYVILLGTEMSASHQ